MSKKEFLGKAELKTMNMIAKLNKYLWIAPLDVEPLKIEMNLKYRRSGKIIISFFILITVYELLQVTKVVAMSTSFFFSLMFRVCF